MEYVYAAMLLHKASQKVDEDSVKKVLEAAGVKPDEGRIKALVSALEGVDIDDAIKNASAAPVAAAATSDAPAAADEAKEDKKEDKEKDDEKNEEEAAAGLGALFG